MLPANILNVSLKALSESFLMESKMLLGVRLRFVNSSPNCEENLLLNTSTSIKMSLKASCFLEDSLVVRRVMTSSLNCLRASLALRIAGSEVGELSIEEDNEGDYPPAVRMSGRFKTLGEFILSLLLL